MGQANGELWLVAAADLVEIAPVIRALVAEKSHSHALALEVLASRGAHHALLAVLEPVAALKGHTLPRVVDLLARQRRWRLVAYLCTHRVLVIIVVGLGRRGSCGATGAVVDCGGSYGIPG